MTAQLLIACKACHRQFDVTGMKQGERVRCQCGELMKVPAKRPHEAQMIHCSSCGGKLRDQATRCEYCGCEITLAERNLGPACPECFARLRAGARFCAECGVKIEPSTLKGIRAAASCPRCKGALVQREVPQGHYTECTHCGGIWLDSQSFETIIEKKDSAALGKCVSQTTSSQAGHPRGTAKTDRVKYVPCPVCGSLMHRKNFARCSGVVIDWCKGHGFWFDTHELEKVLAFIQSGGLDRSRQLEIQRAKEEIERLKDRKKSVAIAGSGWGYHHEERSPDWGFALGEAFSSLLGSFFK